MEPNKLKPKDDITQKALDEITRNGLGIPLVAKETPDKSTIKPNVLTVHGTDMYIKLNDGRLIKIACTEI
jgi:hypothetical protein